MFKLDQKFQNRITANFGSSEFCDFFHLERKKVGNFNFAASSATSWNSFSSSKQTKRCHRWRQFSQRDI